MKDMDIVETLRKHRGCTQAHLAVEMGFSGQGGYTSMLRRKTSVRVDNLVKALAVMDAHLIVRTEGGEEYEVTIDNRSKGFRYPPYLREQFLFEHREQLLACEKQIDKLLENEPEYDGVDFCNVGAGGIQVRLHHKQVKGYTVGLQPTILEDLSNIKEIPQQAAESFRAVDVEFTKNFIADGERYGWD